MTDGTGIRGGATAPFANPVPGRDRRWLPLDPVLVQLAVRVALLAGLWLVLLIGANLAGAGSS